MFHYVYRITNKVIKKHYYGSRSCKCEPLCDLGVHYLSSSSDKAFIEDQKSNPQNYRYKVVRCFDSRVDAYKLEAMLHEKFDVGQNPSFYNRAKQAFGGKCFDITGSAPAKSATTNEKLGMVPLDDPRWSTGEIVGVHTGCSITHIPAKLPTTNEKLGMVSVDDPRWSTGEILHILKNEPNRGNKGKANAIHSTGGASLGAIPLDDPRWSTGEIVHHNHNKYVNHTSAKYSDTGIPIGLVPLDDPRWGTGEIVGVTKGVTVKELPAKLTTTNEKLGMVSLDDPRWSTGEIVHVNKNVPSERTQAICAITGDGLGSVPLDDPRWSTGEIVGINTLLVWISDGTNVRQYIPNGTDIIPSGWCISKVNANSSMKFVDVYNLNGELLYQFVSPSYFADQHGLNRSHVRKCAKRNTSNESKHPYRGLIFVYSPTQSTHCFVPLID